MLRRAHDVALLDYVRRRAPRLIAAADTVADDARQLRVCASSLDRYARYHAPKAMVSTLFEWVVERVEAHQDAQTDLLQETWLTDIGGSG